MFLACLAQHLPIIPLLNVGKGANCMVFETVTRAKMRQLPELAQIQLAPKGCVEVLQNKNL